MNRVTAFLYHHTPKRFVKRALHIELVRYAPRKIARWEELRGRPATPREREILTNYFLQRREDGTRCGFEVTEYSALTTSSGTKTTNKKTAIAEERVWILRSLYHRTPSFFINRALKQLERRFERATATWEKLQGRPITLEERGVLHDYMLTMTIYHTRAGFANSVWALSAVVLAWAILFLTFG